MVFFVYGKCVGLLLAWSNKFSCSTACNLMSRCDIFYSIKQVYLCDLIKVNFITSDALFIFKARTLGVQRSFIYRWIEWMISRCLTYVNVVYLIRSRLRLLYHSSIKENWLLVPGSWWEVFNQRLSSSSVCVNQVKLRSVSTYDKRVHLRMEAWKRFDLTADLVLYHWVFNKIECFLVISYV